VQVNNRFATKNRILILGTGALASLFAARLAESGKDIWMLGSWQAAINTINENGLRLIDGSGKEQRLAVKAISDSQECNDIKYALVLVKSWQTEAAARMLKDCLAEDGLALSLQNGMGNRELLVEALGKRRVDLGSTTTGATLEGPGLVRAGGEGVISMLKSAQTEYLAQAFKASRFEIKLIDDLDGLVWGKLVINAAINPLTALLEIPNGEILERKWLKDWMAALALEVSAVAKAKGVLLPFEDPIAAAIEVARRTAKNSSSMLQDIERGAPTEIDAICGAVVRAGEEFGIESPANQRMWDLVRAKVAGHEIELDEIKIKVDE
jgi:2-dehydropantoate 2-reductase